MTNGTNRFRQWAIYSIFGVMVGCVLGYSLGWIWFFFRLFFLGYGDSAPGWVNTVTNCILLASLVAGIAGGQVLFLKRHNQ
jgi:hypothetical protein